MIGAILVSTEPKLFELGGVPCQCIVINPKQASTVLKYAETNQMPMVRVKFQQTIIGREAGRARAVAFYSSRGPSHNSPGALKPDLMAPGSLILAGWIPNDAVGSIGPSVVLSSEYNMISGTSMACPHVSGVAALLKAAHPEWSPAAIRSAMMTTAFTFDNTRKPIVENGFKSRIASPLAMGAGQIDPNRALDTGLIYDATPQDYVDYVFHEFH
ncbi:Peptidase S8, subtilisin-related [Trema orientale]|uniref:Peptidase S8, subtilisin-related n=1 Tax=Trema orientale TaxID=63057 RepID=A0A2P5FYZ3_TREOI|nr:Peptidase S8, subtilisin-related [Trema orientale]